jgi:hypothetical protein
MTSEADSIHHISEPTDRDSHERIETRERYQSMTRKHKKKNETPKITKAEFQKYWLDDGMSLEQIADKFGMSFTELVYLKSKYNLYLKPKNGFKLGIVGSAGRKYSVLLRIGTYDDYSTALDIRDKAVAAIESVGLSLAVQGER